MPSGAACGGGVCHVFVANAVTDEVLRVTLEGSRPGAKRGSRSEREACMGISKCLSMSAAAQAWSVGVGILMEVRMNRGLI